MNSRIPSSKLERLLTVESAGGEVFAGPTLPLPHGRVFGGLLLAQAMAAAGNTVAPDRGAHSLHGHFVQAGDADEPVEYHVARVRDGRSFSVRTVTARQRHGTLAHMSLSFHAYGEGPTYQTTAASAPPADSATRPFLGHENSAAVAERSGIVLFRAEVPSQGDRLDGTSTLWMRVGAPLPADALLHSSAIAYLSDLTLFLVALSPTNMGAHEVQMASLDHAIWLHRPARADVDLLYVQEARTASLGRAFVAGRIYDTDGRHVASVTQEGLLRTTTHR